MVLLCSSAHASIRMHALMPLDVHPDRRRVAFFNTQGFGFASAVEMVPARTADAFAIVRSFMASRLAVSGLGLVLARVLLALFAPFIAPQNPYDL